METTISPVITYISDGVTVAYPFPFDYLREEFIGVRVNKDAYTDFTVDGKTVTLAQAQPEGAKIKVYRNTSTNRLTDWADGSVLKAKDLNLQHVQVLHILEELYEMNKEWTDENVNRIIKELMADGTLLTPEHIAQALIPYVKEDDLEIILAGYFTENQLQVILNEYAKKTDIPKSVLSVNGQAPDEAGNVNISIEVDAYTKSETDEKLQAINDRLNALIDADNVSY